MDIKEIIENSNCYKECLEKLGLRPHGSNYKKIKEIIKEQKISVEHFWRPEKFSSRNKKARVELKDILVENSNYSRTLLKERLYKNGLKKRECELCGQGEVWKDKKISLILDHINGVPNDNRIENLQIVCPNCNATLDTYCGKNAKKFSWKSVIKKCLCGKEIWSDAENCVVCAKIKMRKVENRPSVEQLKKEVEETNYSAVGRKYGVSDNSIRKWIKNRGSYQNQTGS